MNKVSIAEVADRATVAAALIKSGYTVRSGSQRKPGAKSYDYYLEFWFKSQRNEPGKIYIDNEEDTLAVGTVLIKNKYTVRSQSQVRNGEKRYYHLEYEPNPECDAKKEVQV